MIEKSVSPTFTDAVSTALETGDTSQLKAFSEALDERVLRMKAAVPVQSPRDTSAPQTKVPSVPIRERESVRRKPGDDSIYLRGRIWWITYSNNGEKVCESSGSDKEADARKLLKRRMGEIVTGNFIGPDARKCTVAELADDVVIDYRVNEQDSLDNSIRSANRIKEFSAMPKRTVSRAVKSNALPRRGKPKARPMARSTENWRS